MECLLKKILAARKYVVKKETIAFGDTSNYSPNPSVFQIESGKPWIGAYEITCKGLTPTIGNGVSRESLGILNPQLLYYVNIPLRGQLSASNCSPDSFFIPYNVTYYKNINTITVKIKVPSALIHYGENKIILADANARDMGYNYARISYTRNILFNDKHEIGESIINSMYNQVMNTTGFYHKGGSCGLPSGCNNYSPYNEKLDFDIEGLPATIKINLWKEKPRFGMQKPDLIYEMVFEPKLSK